MSDSGSKRRFKQEHYDLLMKCSREGDMTEWNERYEDCQLEQQEWGCDMMAWLEGADLSDSNLGGADLSYANLKEAKMSRAHLEGANLSIANLEGAYLNGAHLERTELERASLKDAILFKAHLEGAYMNGAHLEGTSLDGAHLEGACMNGAYLEKANLSEAHLEGACMNGAHLGEAYLNAAHLEGACLEKADLSYANLKEAYLNGAHLNGAHLEGAYLNGAHLEGAYLTGVNLISAVVEWDQLNVAKSLESITFPQIHIFGKDMSNKVLSNSVLEGVTIENTNLKGAKFRMARVDGTTLITGEPKEIIDDDTDFTGVGLSTARIDPKLRTRLERNIRKKQWEEWYDQHVILQGPLRLFWWLSDYGTTCTRCIWAFALLIMVAFITYTWITGIAITGMPQLFANTILATFGFGGLYDQLIEIEPALLLLAAHVLAGYFLLAVLITRFAIMFQSLSP